MYSQAIVWIFCFGSNFEINTIVAEIYRETVGGKKVLYTLAKYPRSLLGSRRSNGNYFFDKAAYNLFWTQQLPAQWSIYKYSIHCNM